MNTAFSDFMFEQKCRAVYLEKLDDRLNARAELLSVLFVFAGASLIVGWFLYAEWKILWATALAILLITIAVRPHFPAQDKRAAVMFFAEEQAQFVKKLEAAWNEAPNKKPGWLEKKLIKYQAEAEALLSKCPDADKLLADELLLKKAREECENDIETADEA